MVKCTKCRERRASFNWPTEIIALFCKLCMLEGMINVMSKKCVECDKQPSYNDEGQPVKYCKDHAKSGMVDVVSKRCKQEGCEKQAHFEGWCGEHKPEGSQSSYKKCPCGKLATFGNPLTMKPEFCGKCKLEGMINVRNKVCEHSECQK